MTHAPPGSAAAYRLPRPARTTGTAPIAAALEAIEGLSKLPVGWWHAWRVLDKVGVTTPKAPVIFECVGVPGMLEHVLTGHPGVWRCTEDAERFGQQDQPAGT